jgi:hypothetical protein
MPLSDKVGRLSPAVTPAVVFQHIKAILEQHFENPEIEAAKVIFACVAAHRIVAHPQAWLLAIAPPGSIKTVLLESMLTLPSVHFVDEVTDKTFISGKMDDHGKVRKASASYLHRIGSEGILVAADFGTILSTDRRVRDKILSQLRRIYDGRFSREFGTDEHIAERVWEGRLTLLAGATPAVDNYHSVFQSLGERFIRVRWQRAGGITVGVRAINQNSSIQPILRAAVGEFLRPLLSSKQMAAPEIPPDLLKCISSLGELVALARADVPRTRYTHEVCGEAAPEGNTRLSQQLAQVGRGWAVLNGRTVITDEDYALILRAGMDSMPPIRRQALGALVQGISPYSINLPESTMNRALEDLELLGLAARESGNWRLSQFGFTLAQDIGLRTSPNVEVCGGA